MVGSPAAAVPLTLLQGRPVHRCMHVDVYQVCIEGDLGCGQEFHATDRLEASNNSFSGGPQLCDSVSGTLLRRRTGSIGNMCRLYWGGFARSMHSTALHDLWSQAELLHVRGVL